MLRFYLVLSVCLAISSISLADSLWSPNTNSIYKRTRNPQIGDIVTVKIMNQSAATHEAGTNTSKRSNMGLDYYSFKDNYKSSSADPNINRSRNDYNLGGSDTYSGVGRTSRKSKVQTTMSAVIVQILDNGNLYIVGEHTVNVNNEKEIIQISGVIRQDDISPENEVLSHQIANAKISIKGEGVVGSKQEPGLMSKMFGWIF